MHCLKCESQQVVKNGKVTLRDGVVVQKYVCRKQFNDRTGTPMARLRTSSTIVTLAMNVRTEGMGVRATGRSFGKSHSTILRWEERLANQLNQWSPTAPETADLTVEGDEIYTRVGENLPPQ